MPVNEGGTERACGLDSTYGMGGGGGGEGGVWVQKKEKKFFLHFSAVFSPPPYLIGFVVVEPLSFQM